VTRQNVYCQVRYDTSKIYVGSTIQTLSHRMCDHLSLSLRKAYKLYNEVIVTWRSRHPEEVSPFFGKKVECLRRLLPPSTHSSSAAFITPPRGRSRHLRRPAITSLSTPESSRMRGDVRRVSAFSFFYRPTARPRRTSPPSACQRNNTSIHFAVAARYSTMA
jgi:hypothetical protein